MEPPPRKYTNDSPSYEAHSQAAQWHSSEAAYDYDDEDGDDDIASPTGDNDGSGEGRFQKRRRIARACDMCRKKKIKCDGKMPKCGHCENHKTECIFTPQEKKRAPPKGAKYIEGLENRLGRMESLLKLSGLLTEDDGGRTDLGTLEKKLAERQVQMGRSYDSNPPAPTMQAQIPTFSNNSSGQSSHSRSTPQSEQPQHVTPRHNIAHDAKPPTKQVQKPAPQQQQQQSPAQKPFIKTAKYEDILADQMCSLITNNVGETRYIGSSSGFSIFSPKGVQWVNAKTGDNSFQSMIGSATSEDRTGWDHWRPEVFNDLFARRVFKPLPSRQECYALMKDYFENFNCMFPLFHEPTFMHLVDRHYSMHPYEGSGWWASLNVALAIAHRLRVMSNVVPQEEDSHAWGYLKNAMAVVTELTMRNTDLLSVQALLGMAMFLQGTPNPQPSFFLVGSAIRLAHSIGLHKRGSGFNLNAAEDEQRKRVFWIAYLLDKDICLRSGRPPAQDDDDMNVELPSEDPPDSVGNIPLAKEIDGKKTMNLFLLMCTFAQIQSQVYKQLYSVKASRQSDGELLNTIGELDASLEEWKDSIPLDFRPEHEINAAHTPLILHVVVLHFAYYNCLTTIHRMSVHHGYWTSRLSDYAIQGLNARPLNPRVFMSAALCVNAARTSIGLIRYIPQGDYACVWLILYYPVSALVTLFANILQNPQDARARGDLRLMSSVCAFLTMLERETSDNGNVGRMLSVCREFERIASVVLDKAERELRGGRTGKRKAGVTLSTAADRDREKLAKERERDGNGVQFERSLSEGKSLEQIQVETQAPYRRPVQTPSLRISHGGSMTGGGNADTPASLGSPAGGVGPEYRSPATHGASIHVNGANHSNKPISPWLDSADPNFAMQSAAYQPQHQQQQQQDYSNAYNNQQPAGNLPTDNGMYPPLEPLNGMDMHNGGPVGSATDFGAAGMASGSFQQPFVPQDLWQMPMTFEWDWADLGSFTPGPLFEGFTLGDGGGLEHVVGGGQQQ